ncbi:TetR/AcrR family transcriptional regulator C-terminal domain-containing protein [Streptomyces sp. NPDC059340]|uniref:TetR/AcrR family transcriptional regulator C-terminal domain-containing protein n=1 Tax=Streptomyces sp. NPDC059340 TaxID=3346806 RepID=UPI0036B07F2F
MSLYNHVDDKTDVLDAVADVIPQGIEIRDVDAMSWQDGLRGLARAFRAVALKYPHSATLVPARRLNALAAVPVVEAALRVPARAGLEGAAAVHALRAFIAFLIGTLAREVGSAPTYAGANPGVVAGRERDFVKSGLPAVAAAAAAAAVAADLAFCDREAEVEFGLELFDGGVRRRVDAAG